MAKSPLAGLASYCSTLAQTRRSARLVGTNRPLKPFEMDRDLTVLKSCTRWLPLLHIAVAI